MKLILIFNKIIDIVKRRVWLEVTVAETWIFDLESKYVQEDRMSKVDCERQALDLASSHKNSRW